jgi:hypothetical protein
VITFDPILDTASLLRAPAEEKLAMVRAYHVHFDPANPQETRDAGARFFYRVLLPYVSTEIRPN